MAGVRDKQLQTFSSFPVGINNTADEEKLPRDDHGKLLAARDAVNTDFSETGKPGRRDGYTQVHAGTAAHSAWSDDYLPFGLYVDGDTLYAVQADESRDALLSGLAPGLPLSYCRINDAICWTNGVQSGQVTLDFETRPWACPGPAARPLLTAVAHAGALDAGSYQVTTTFLDAWGRESGALRAAPIDVPQDHGIHVEQIPQPPAGGRVRLYVTGGHDGLLRPLVTLAEGITEFVITDPPTGSRTCETMLLQPLPPGQLVATGNARQYVARGREVLYSPVLRYGLFDPRKGRVGFNTRVDMIAFVGDGTDGAGLYVSDGKRTYWLAGGDPAQWKQVIAMSCGAVPGQITFAPGDVWGLDSRQLLPVWQARNGRLVVGMPGGQLYLPQPRERGPDAVFDKADAAALLYRETAGDRRVISALRGAGPQTVAIRDALIVTEYPHEA